MAGNGVRRGYQEGGRLVPIPDPTLLTTQQLDREITNLETRMEAELKAIHGHVDAVKMIDQGHFERIQIQFAERDKQVGLALQGQKDLAGLTTEYINTTIAKMDATYTKLFDQMQILLASKDKRTDDKIDDLKGRLDRTEASKGRIDVMQIFAALASLAAVAGFFFLLLTRR
jgi:predicted nuclease with TOPRIM domain